MAKDNKMIKESCVFCKIANGELKAAKIWEDEDFFAILDRNPNTHGMTLVLTKEHYDSNIFEMPEEIYCEFFLALKKVALILEKGLRVKRIAMVMEGMGVNHAHIKLYPLHGVEEKFQEMWAKDKIYFHKYEGYLSTQLGPERTHEELNDLANKIKIYSKK